MAVLSVVIIELSCAQKGARMEYGRLTTNVENTKSSSLRPQLGLEDMSPTTDAPTPMTCTRGRGRQEWKKEHGRTEKRKGSGPGFQSVPSPRTHLLEEDLDGELGVVSYALCPPLHHPVGSILAASTLGRTSACSASALPCASSTKPGSPIP